VNAKEVIKISLQSTGDMLTQFLGDLSDDDVLVRPVPAANNIAWQVGHLIAIEAMLRDMLPGATYPEVPAGLNACADGKTAKTAPPGGYLKKAEYVDWFKKVRSATIANVDRLSEADLDKPTPGDFAAWAPTLGALLVLTANHTLMHGGQFSVVRRALNKPVLF
jgi:hypothetical protein